jgi:hypothetical protein
MRTALFATAAMNLVAACLFLPVGSPVRALLGLPAEGHPLYLTTIALFVALFGVGYLWAALANRAERVFIGMAAIGKLSFVALLVSFWLAGAIPAQAPLLAMGDVLFGLLFLFWLCTTRA